MTPTFAALATTITVEASCLWFLGNRCRAIRRLVWLSVPVNLATQQLFATLLQRALTGHDWLWWPYFWAGEVMVVFIEAAIYSVWIWQARAGGRLALLAAAVANGISLLLGLALRF